MQLQFLYGSLFFHDLVPRLRAECPSVRPLKCLLQGFALSVEDVAIFDHDKTVPVLSKATPQYQAVPCYDYVLPFSDLSWLKEHKINGS